MFKKTLLLCVIGLILPLISDAQIPPGLAVTGSDTGWYYALEPSYALSIGANYNAGADICNISLSAGTTRIDVDSLLANGGYALRSVTIYSDEDITVDYHGADINAYDGSDSYTGSYIRAGKAQTWEYTNLTLIRLHYLSAAATVDVYFRATKIK